MKISIMGLLTGLLLLVSAFAQEDRLSCSEYESLVQRNVVDRAFFGLKGAERCEAIPADCGPTWLLLNGSGSHTYYYKSACYYDLAEKELNEKLCVRVKERRELFQDGSNYSPEACFKRVGAKRRAAGAAKIAPEKIARAVKVEASLDARENLSVVLYLGPDAAASGQYAISALGHYEVVPNGQPQKHPVIATYNFSPEHAAIRYDQYANMYTYPQQMPISNSIAEITPGMLKDGFLIFNIPSRQIKSVKPRDIEEGFRLEVVLQFLEAKTGEVPDPSLSRERYKSKASTQVSLLERL